MPLFARFAAAATAALLLSGLVVPQAVCRSMPGAGMACGKGARECCCGSTRMAAPSQPCMKKSCAFQGSSAPAAPLSPQREVPGRVAFVLSGSSPGRFPLIGRVFQAEIRFPAVPPRLPPLPPPRLLSA